MSYTIEVLVGTILQYFGCSSSVLFYTVLSYWRRLVVRRSHWPWRSLDTAGEELHELAERQLNNYNYYYKQNCKYNYKYHLTKVSGHKVRRSTNLQNCSSTTPRFLLCTFIGTLPTLYFHRNATYKEKLCWSGTAWLEPSLTLPDPSCYSFSFLCWLLLFLCWSFCHASSCFKLTVLTVAGLSQWRTMIEDTSWCLMLQFV